MSNAIKCDKCGRFGDDGDQFYNITSMRRGPNASPVEQWDVCCDCYAKIKESIMYGEDDGR